ncbi:MAG: hypothetical protein R3F11_16390 [Verrucomicrobiales bacterium]
MVDAAGGPLRAVAQHGSYASGAHWLPGQNAVLSAYYDGRPIWSDAAEGKPIREVGAHTFWSWQSAVAPGGALVRCPATLPVSGRWLRYELAPSASHRSKSSMRRRASPPFVRHVPAGAKRRLQP